MNTFAKSCLPWVMVSLTSLPAAAQTGLEHVDLRPLVRLHSEEVISLAGAPIVEVLHRDLFISRGGGMISIQVSCNLLAGCEFNAQVAEGVSPSEALQELSGKYGQGKIGFQAGDCKLEPPPLASPYRYDIKWYGRNGRQNSFSVGSGLATPCPAELRDIVVATLIFEGKVLADPGTRILRSGS